MHTSYSRVVLALVWIHLTRLSPVLASMDTFDLEFLRVPSSSRDGF